jgi:hypothetical protein
LALMCTTSFAILDAPRISAASPSPTTSSVTVASVDQYGNAVSNEYYAVFQAALYGPDNIVATGFTNSTFATTAGSSYSLQLFGSVVSCTFTDWSGGVSSNPLNFTATSGALSFTAVFNCSGSKPAPAPRPDSSIIVNSDYMGGAALTGVYATLEQGGAVVASGFTPATFATTSGLNYSVIISDATNAYFSQWSNGVVANTIDVKANSTQTPLTAFFCPTACGPDTVVVSGATGPTGSITVTSSNLNTGAVLTGMYVDLRLDDNHIESGYTPVTFSGLQLSTAYLVVLYGYGDNYFRHFSNGNLERYAYVTLNSTAGETSYSMNGLYETVPNSQAASLNIIAQFPNGTQIGTASVIGGYPQHTPGMYLTVTPPGAGVPYTATFTGGSILPFILFNGQTYTVAMSTGYSNITFTSWQDNGSTDPTRTFTLSGNSTYIAIYTQG